MRRWIVMGMMLLMTFSLSACSGRETGQQEQDRIEHSAGQQTEEPPTESDVSVSPQAVEKDDGQHILIAYFTWAENTHVENPEEVDVDATTSASVLPPGNAAKLAGWIQEQTGGELFSIVVKEPYSSDYDECLDRAAEEEAEDVRPELVNHVEKHKVLAMIQREKLKDDDGKPFRFNSHMFRHYYGVKLTEMHLDDWTIAKLLGHKGLGSVQHYRKMSNQLMADETRAVRDMMTKIIYENLDGWSEEYEQIRHDDYCEPTAE